MTKESGAGIKGTGSPDHYLDCTQDTKPARNVTFPHT